MAHADQLTTRAEREAFRSASRACYAGLDSVSLRTELARRVAPVVPLDASSFCTTDPDTGLLTHAVSEGLSFNLARAYLDHVYPSETALTSLDSVRAGKPVVHMIDLSRTLRDTLTEAGIEHEMNTLAYTAGGLWGAWCMMRERGAPPFGERETRFMRMIAPHIARGLKTAALRDTAQPVDTPADCSRSNGAGVVVLDARWRVTLRNSAAAAQLKDLGDIGLRPGELPHAVVSVLIRLRHNQELAASAPRSRGDAELPVRGRVGQWYTLRASFTEPDEAGQSSAIILIEPLAPREMAPILTRLYGLSLREREVLTLVVRGASTKQIASQLKISAYTVQDHLDKACDKVGVRGRRALVAKLWFDGYAPRL